MAVAQHLLQRRVQRDDVTRALALRQCERGVFKKRIEFRFRNLRSPRNFSSSAHTPTLRGLIPGRNQLSQRPRPWFSRNGKLGLPLRSGHPVSSPTIENEVGGCERADVTKTGILSVE